MKNEKKEGIDCGRRAFLGGLATLVAGVALAPGAAFAQDDGKTAAKEDEARKDLEFTRNWTRTMMDAVAEQRKAGAGDKIDIREAMRRCSRVCYDKNGFDAIIKEGDFDGFLKTARDDFGWGIERDGNTLTVRENNTVCLCPMVRACNGKMTTSLCTCTETELERMFARASGGKVKARVVNSILAGDPSCVYRIELA